MEERQEPQDDIEWPHAGLALVDVTLALLGFT
jgi:hypothetical protein